MANYSRQNEGKPVGTDNADITVVTGRIDNVESALVGNLSLTGIDINGGAIDGTAVGANSANTGTFTHVNASTLVLSGTASINGDAIFSSDVTASGSVNVASMVTTGDVSVGGDLVVTSTLTIGKTLGAWDTATYAKDTEYQATSDLLVCATISVANLNGWTMAAITDSASPPTTTVAASDAYQNLTGGNLVYIFKNSLFFPVKNGDYWKVTATARIGGSAPTVTIAAIPLGA
jgi:hypothetical protein